MLRLLVVAIAIVPATVWYGAQVLWHAYRGSPPSADVFDRAPRRWSRLILRLSGVRVELENAEAVDPTRSQILVANHTSWYDVLALAGYLPGRFVFVAKKELEGVPIFGRAASACGQIFIDRQDRGSAIESLEKARRSLEEARPTVIMFPEGTRSPDGALRPFKKGAFVLAIQAGVEVVPAAIVGSREVMRKGSLLIRPGTITVRFGEPIHVSGLAVEDRNQLTERAWQALAALQASRPSLKKPT
jgi:1-acyl-sn-glycerol-3-phosphate acyltransferase